MELLARGADPNLVSDDGAGPALRDAQHRVVAADLVPAAADAYRDSDDTSYLELMEALLEAGAEPESADVSTHIWYAAYNAGRMGVDFTGATPFWRAAYAADVEAMKLLVAARGRP